LLLRLLLVLLDPTLLQLNVWRDVPEGGTPERVLPCRYKIMWAWLEIVLGGEL